MLVQSACRLGFLVHLQTLADQQYPNTAVNETNVYGLAFLQVCTVYVLQILVAVFVQNFISPLILSASPALPLSSSDTDFPPPK